MVYFVGAGPGAPDFNYSPGAGTAETGGYYYLCRLPGECAAAEGGACVLSDLQQRRHDTGGSGGGSWCRGGQEGKNIVRLHPGIPACYGAIREQMDRLEEAGIAFEVCPGVSSFAALRALLQAEYTLPGVSPDGDHHPDGGTYPSAGEGG